MRRPSPDPLLALSCALARAAARARVDRGHGGPLRTGAATLAVAGGYGRRRSAQASGDRRHPGGQPGRVRAFLARKKRSGYPGRGGRRAKPG
eukprot:95360-Prorocentrum_minimum.AAC.2